MHQGVHIAHLFLLFVLLRQALAVELKLALNYWFFCPCLPSVGISCTYCHPLPAWLLEISSEVLYLAPIWTQALCTWHTDVVLTVSHHPGAPFASAPQKLMILACHSFLFLLLKHIFLVSWKRVCWGSSKSLKWAPIIDLSSSESLQKPLFAICGAGHLLVLSIWKCVPTGLGYVLKLCMSLKMSFFL